MPRHVLLHISAGDGEEGHEAHDDTGQHQGDPATPPAQAAHGPGAGKLESCPAPWTPVQSTRRPFFGAGNCAPCGRPVMSAAAD